MSTVKKSLIFSFADSYLGIIIQLTSSIFLARLLTPTEIGQFSIGVAILAIAHMVRDFGTGSYLIQEKNLTKQKIQTAFGITLSSSWLLAITLFFSSSSIGNFYDEENITTIVMWMSLNFLVIPFSSIVLSMLRREMKFHTLLYINTTSSFISACLAIYLASTGHSYMSLVWSSIANIVLTAMLAALFRPRDAFILPRLKNVREIISFGGKASLSNIIAESGRNATDLILGKNLGFASVAIYSKAQTINNMFSHNILSAIHNVYFPLIADYNRDNKALDIPFINATNYITAIAFPFFGFLAFYSEEIILLMFGHQWVASAPIINILAIAGAIYAIWGLAPKTLYAINKPGEVLTSELIIQISRVILVASAAFFSLQMVAWAQVATYGIGAIIYLSFIKKNINLTILNFLNTAVVPNLIISAFSLFTTHYINSYLLKYYEGIFLAVIIPAFILAILWVLFIFLFRHPIRTHIKINRIPWT